MEHKGTQTLSTERLILRCFQTSDAEAMFENWANDPRVVEYLTWDVHGDITVTQSVLATWVESYQKADYYQWAIEYAGTLIGAIGAHDINEQLRSVAFGYCIGHQWWGLGIMTEALAAVLDYLFAIGFNRIWAIHEVNNPASGRVMQKCGLQLEGTIRQGAADNSGNIHDVVQYAIIAADRNPQ